MSILVEKIIKNVSSGNGDINIGNYPPGPVKNVNLSPTHNSIKVTMTQPDNTVINSLTLSIFSYLICVLKKDNIPSNIDDGTSITVYSNQFSNGSYSITYNNLDYSSKYYIRFFTFSTNNECNNSGEMIYEVSTQEPISTILNDNDWETVIKVAESGQAENYWDIGDEIELQLSGVYNITCTMQIWGFNHFNNPRFGGNTYNDNICFGCKDIYIKEKIHDGIADSWWDYKDSYIYETVCPNIYNSMPSVVRNAIKKVGSIDYRTDVNGYSFLYDQTVFIPTMGLVGVELNNEIASNYFSPFSIFTNDASRIKNYNGAADDWWLVDGELGSLKLASISDKGTLSFPTFDIGKNIKHGVVFCFNI